MYKNKLMAVYQYVTILIKVADLKQKILDNS